IVEVPAVRIARVEGWHADEHGRVAARRETYVHLIAIEAALLVARLRDVPLTAELHALDLLDELRMHLRGHDAVADREVRAFEPDRKRDYTGFVCALRDRCELCRVLLARQRQLGPAIGREDR